MLLCIVFLSSFFFVDRLVDDWLLLLLHWICCLNLICILYRFLCSSFELWIISILRIIILWNFTVLLCLCYRINIKNLLVFCFSFGLCTARRLCVWVLIDVSLMNWRWFFFCLVVWMITLSCELVRDGK